MPRLGDHDLIHPTRSPSQLQLAVTVGLAWALAVVLLAVLLVQLETVMCQCE